MKTSLDNVYAAGVRLRSKAEQAAQLYNAYYGKFSPQLSRALYGRITEASSTLQNVKDGLEAEGYDAGGLGSPLVWIGVIAAAVAVGAISYFGAEAVESWSQAQLAACALEEKKLDAAISAGLTEAYLIDGKSAVPPEVSAGAAGLGIGAVLALAAVGWFLFSSRGAR